MIANALKEERFSQSPSLPHRVRAVLLCCLLSFFSSGIAWAQPPQDKEQPIATVSVATDAIGREIPSNFIGFSLSPSEKGDGMEPLQGENAQLQSTKQPAYALGYPDDPNTGYFRLMRNLGKGYLRLGGSGQDNICWRPAHAPHPEGCQAELTDRQLKLFSDAAEASGWQLIVGMNLKQNSPSWASSEVIKGIAHEIKPEQVFALEFGNEPEGFGGHYRPTTYTSGDHARDFMAYMQALRSNSVAKRYAIVGPSTCCEFCNARDLSIFARAVNAKENLRWLTVHNYAINMCADESATIERLLSPTLMAKQNRKLTSLVEVARSEHMPIALAETNSVSCGGKPGVSDVFAAALWGLDYAFSLAGDGFINVDFETSYRPGGSSYNPIDTYVTKADTGHLNYQNVAKPLYYGLYLFSRNASGTHFLPVSINSNPNSPSDVNIQAYAVSGCSSCAVKVFVLNKDMKAAGLVRVELDRKMGTGRLLLLDAPKLDSPAADVRYGGQQFGSDGNIEPPTTKTVDPDKQGNYEFTLPNAAVAVLTIERTLHEPHSSFSPGGGLMDAQVLHDSQ